MHQKTIKSMMGILMLRKQIEQVIVTTAGIILTESNVTVATVYVLVSRVFMAAAQWFP